mmetsp:Transcript_23075/g.50606  ORF Transcript_23075/g.50606 Transcript_23075/m.50606 type:complete len:247 (-) Transcript_23075:213-953(-)
MGGLPPQYLHQPRPVEPKPGPVDIYRHLHLLQFLGHALHILHVRFPVVGVHYHLIQQSHAAISVQASQSGIHTSLHEGVRVGKHFAHQIPLKVQECRGKERCLGLRVLGGRHRPTVLVALYPYQTENRTVFALIENIICWHGIRRRTLRKALKNTVVDFPKKLVADTLYVGRTAERESGLAYYSSNEVIDNLDVYIGIFFIQLFGYIFVLLFVSLAVFHYGCISIVDLLELSQRLTACSTFMRSGM